MLNLLSIFYNIFLGSEEKILPNDIIMNKSEEKVGESTQDETSIEENEPDTDDCHVTVYSKHSFKIF